MHGFERDIFRAFLQLSVGLEKIIGDMLTLVL
jgi:hypothetical protein